MTKSAAGLGMVSKARFGAIEEVSVSVAANGKSLKPGCFTGTATSSNFVPGSGGVSPSRQDLAPHARR